MAVSSVRAGIGARIRADAEQREERIRAAVLEAAQAGARHLQKELPKDLGELRRSVQVYGEADGGARIDIEAPHGIIIERGARPHMPPLGPLIAWVKRHLGEFGVAAPNVRSRNPQLRREARDAVERQIESIARAIAWKIYQHGSPPRWIVRGSLPVLRRILARLLKARLRRSQVTLEPRRAVRKALASYLEAQLAAAYPSLVVYDHWPEGDSLAALALSVVVPTGEIELREFPPVILNFAPGPGDETSTVQYSHGIASIGLQLDLWTGFEEARDELVNAIVGVVNRPPAATLGVTTLPQLSTSCQLVIRVPDFYNALCNIDLPHFPDVPNDSETRQTGRWRATWRGQAELHLLKEEAVAILRHLQTELAVNGSAAETVNLF